jgi:hypothetical protein
MVSLNWGEIFTRGISTGVKEFSNVAKAKDVSIKAEAKASAEAFAEANENYKNEVENNKKALAKEVDSISDLVGGDVNKIRTIMKTYGNAEVVSQLQKDFEKYQADAFFKEAKTGEKVKFKSLKEYINGRLTQTGTAFVSDEAAEQAADEAAVVGDELDIQKAEEKAKGMGITLEQYLNTQARKLSSKPAFSVEGKAARLVEESKMGLFGKTLTMEEARQMVTSGQKLGGEEAEDLGDTGYALPREGGLGASEKAKILSEVRQMKEETGESYSASDKIKLRNDIGKTLSANKLAVGDSVDGFKVLNTKPALSAAVKEIEERLNDPKLSAKDKSVYESLKGEFERKLSQLGVKDTTQLQIEKEETQRRKNNNKEPKKFKENPTIGNLKELKKQGHKFFITPDGQLANIQDTIDIQSGKKPKKQKTEIKAATNSVDPRPTDPIKAAEWDKKYGKTHYPKNGRPKTQQQINYEQRVS